MTERKFDKDTYPTSLSLFNPIHRNMGQVIRHVHIDDLGEFEWRAKSRKKP